MGRYRKIDTRIWNDEKVRRLSSDARHFFLYLLTSQHSTAWGAYVLDDLYVQADLQFTLSQIRKCWAEVVREQLANRDEQTRLVCFPNWFKYNPPENKKTSAACINGILSMPRCKALTEFCQSSEWVREQLANRSLTPPEPDPDGARTPTETLEGEQRATSTNKDLLEHDNRTAAEPAASRPPVLALAKSNGTGPPKPSPSKRVPEAFDLTPERLKFATGLGLSIGEAQLQFDAMCDCEFSKAHQDWEAVWRNWVRRHVTDRPRQVQRR